MALLTADEIKSRAEVVAKTFDDGFQMTDLLVIVPQVMELVGAVKAMTGAEKKETAVAILNLVIDEVDIPKIPDWMVDPILKALVPHLIEFAYKIDQGAFSFSGESTPEG